MINNQNKRAYYRFMDIYIINLKIMVNKMKKIMKMIKNKIFKMTKPPKMISKKIHNRIKMMIKTMNNKELK